jgi:hypothetical protein
MHHNVYRKKLRVDLQQSVTATVPLEPEPSSMGRHVSGEFKMKRHNVLREAMAA